MVKKTTDNESGEHESMADDAMDLHEVKLKSAKNMVGYAEDKEVDPKLIKVGELVREAAEEESEPDFYCTPEEQMEIQKKKEEDLVKQRFTTSHPNK